MLLFTSSLYNRIEIGIIPGAMVTAKICLQAVPPLWTLYSTQVCTWFWSLTKVLSEERLGSPDHTYLLTAAASPLAGRVTWSPSSGQMDFLSTVEMKRPSLHSGHLRQPHPLLVWELDTACPGSCWSWGAALGLQWRPSKQPSTPSTTYWPRFPLIPLPGIKGTVYIRLVQK